MASFYENQVAAATNILGVFASGTSNYALLIAEMQSGKTGAFQALIQQALQTHLVDRAYILCGSAEKVLRKQAHDETKKYNPVPNAAKQIEIFFRQDFAKASSHMDIRRALIVIDESHLDSFNGSEMMKYLAEHELTLQGTTAKMVAEQTYICSVSATPYAELAKIRDGTSLPKHVEHLQSGPDYYGLRHYEADGLLRETFDIATHFDTFRSLLQSVTSPKWILMRAVNTETVENVRTICSIIGMPIVEYTSARKDVAINKDEAKALGMPETNSLDFPPGVPTIVHIKGTCRVGKVVPKKHIAFVWEDSKSPRTDTLVQALPGRMCGYAEAFGPEKPTIYVSKTLLEGRNSVLTLTEGRDRFSVSELDRHGALTEGMPVIPTKGMNLTRSYLPKREVSDLVHTVPFLLDCSELASRTEKAVYTHLQENMVSLTEQPAWSQLSSGQQTEILEYLTHSISRHNGRGSEARTLHVSRLHASSGTGAQSYFKAVLTAHETATTVPFSAYNWTLTETETSVGFHIVEELIPGLPASARPGQTYIIFYTTAPPTLEAIPLRARIPETDTDTVFDSFTLTEELIRKAAIAQTREYDYEDDIASLPSSMQGGGGAASSISASTVTSDPVSVPIAVTPEPQPQPPLISYMHVPMTADMSENPERMRAFLVDNIQGTTGTRTISPAFRLCKTAYHFTGSQKKGHDFCTLLREIGEARGLRVSFECGTGSDYTKNFYIKSITWTPK